MSQPQPSATHRVLRAVSRRLPPGLRRRARRLAGRPSVSTRKRRQAFLAALDRRALPSPPAASSGLVALAAVSERLRVGLAPEWVVRSADGTSWRAQLEQPPTPRLVLLEWTPAGVPGLERADLAQLVAGARATGVPVVVWATDSSRRPWPADHPVTEADHVLADDERTARAWTELSGREVGTLWPAASPVVHSPALTGSTTRRQEAVAVVTPHLENLHHFAHLPPDNVDVWVPPSLPVPGPEDDAPPSPGAAAAGEAERRAAERLRALRTDAVVRRALDGRVPALGHYRSVTGLEGGTGSGWPLVEASMAATPLVLDEETAALLPPDLVGAHTRPESTDELRLDATARLWQRELVEREGLVASRTARRAHTFAHRARALAAVAGCAEEGSSEPDRTVSVVVPTNRPHELDNVIANVARQDETPRGNVQLVLVLHAVDVDEAGLRNRIRAAGIEHFEVLRADASQTLGACMNLGIDAAAGRYVAKVDDDNYYGRHYLSDLVDAFTYTDAGIVGKWAHYVWLRSSGAVLLRNRHSEYRDERLVQGGTIVLRRDVARELRFGDLPRAVDTDLLNRARDAGVRVFSADRFNFVSIRGLDRHAHTWPIADTALMNRAGELLFFGDPREHVDV